MTRAINTSVRLFTETFDPGGPVVDVGSYYVPGYESIADLRPYFRGREYIGCDIRRGPGVDRIEDAEALTFADESVGTVVMCEILEHLRHPWDAVAEARRVLRDDGLLVLSVPFSIQLHGWPNDYWRFTSAGIGVLLEAFEDSSIFALGPRQKPAFVFAVAAKGRTPEFEDRKALFEQRVHEEFHAARLWGHTSVARRIARDAIGWVLGRAELGAVFLDPDDRGPYWAAAAVEELDGRSGSVGRASP